MGHSYRQLEHSLALGTAEQDINWTFFQMDLKKSRYLAIFSWLSAIENKKIWTQYKISIWKGSFESYPIEQADR